MPCVQDNSGDLHELFRSQKIHQKITKNTSLLISAQQDTLSHLSTQQLITQDAIVYGTDKHDARAQLS